MSQAPSPDGSSSVVSQVQPPKRYDPPNAPNSIEDVQAIASWQGLCKDRRAWALHVLEDCADMDATAQARFEEMDVIIKCLDAAVANLEISVKQLEPKYTELKKWVEPALEDHARLSTSWQQYLALARNTPVAPSVVRFMTRSQISKSNPTLEDLIEPETAKKAGKLASTAHRRFSDKAADLDKAANRMYESLDNLIADFDRLVNRSVLGRSDESAQLLQDIEAVAKQIDSDYRATLSYGGSQRDVAQASKAASNHTERLVPTLKRRAKEMDDLVHYATQSRNAIASESVEFMKAITEITSLRGNVKDHINVLNQSEDDMTTFDYLRLIHQLPYMYASFLVEAIRRHEWNGKVKADSSTLANEMALFQDEESKRRRKWQKMVGSTYGPGLDTNVMGLEVSVLGDDSSWPTVNKNELEVFLGALKEQDMEEEILEDVAQLIRELDSPTKQQSKRLKAFKNGSVHEAALGRSGLMIRGDDDLLRSLQDDKSKLESKVKTAESRVRRLEDLLHRQSQAARPGNLFQPQTNSTHERNDSSSSIRSGLPDGQRMSSDGTDSLLRRVSELENDLREEKQRSSRIQKDLTNRATEHDDMKDQIQEVNSTKKDLLENMEALKREFVEERKSLEDEIKTLKARLEDTEDEIEHFGESREKERASYEERVQQLEIELERVDRERKDETSKAQGQVEFLTNESRIQREQRDSLERELQTAKDQVHTISQNLGNLQEAADGTLQSLRDLHSQLADSGLPPDDSELADAVQTAVTDLLAKLQNMESDNSLARDDLDQTRNLVKELREELASTRDKLAAEEASSLHARESVSEEKARVEAVEHELAQSREQLSNARARLAAGETGSETLQKRVEEEEKKVASLSEELAMRQSHVGSLEEELRSFKEKLDAAQGKVSHLSGHHDGRGERSKELTQRLYSQNDRMCHLLERLGYAVSRKDDAMAITKVPRAERTVQNLNDSSDPGTLLRKSGMLGAKALHDSAELDLLHWTSSSDATVEAEKYAAFMSKLGDFDTDLFADTIYHRVKEVEHKARKWQKEARAYRDRAHMVQKDSHDKIAFKHFKEGDLALFLPTRNQQAGAWAAFNVGFPHYFLREQDAHRLRNREWLVARITRIQERVVDLSKSLQPSTDSALMNDEENDNPFQLSDGLRWYLIDAQEDKPGAPSTPGMGKSTVAANNVEATANIHTHTAGVRGKHRDNAHSIEGINKSLSKSLESRRSSSSSKRALPFAGAGAQALLKSNPIASETNSLRAAAPETPTGTSPDGVRHQPGPSGTSGITKSNDRGSNDRDGESRAKPKVDTEAQQDESRPTGNEDTTKTPEVRTVDSLLGP